MQSRMKNILSRLLSRLEVRLNEKTAKKQNTIEQIDRQTGSESELRK
jgi:hypothetical protein